jgi:hypothetical protein
MNCRCVARPFRLGDGTLPLHAPGVRQRAADATDGPETGHQKLQKKIDSRCRLSELRREKTGKNQIIMSPERFNQCLRVIRWTPINIASALQCELSWIEALEVGNEEVPAGLATWLETLAQAHEALPPPSTYRGKRSTF